MKRLLGGLTAAALLGLLPFAVAQEPAKGAPAAPAPSAAPQPGAEFFKRFDLNKDGKVDWEEFQKVKSGFAALDVDHDGAITQPDMAKFAEQTKERMQKEIRRRVMREMRQGRRGMGPGGFGPMGPPRGMGRGWMQPDRRGFGPGPQGWQGPRGRRGPGMGRGPGPGGGGMGEWGAGDDEPPEDGGERMPPPGR